MGGPSPNADFFADDDAPKVGAETSGTPNICSFADDVPKTIAEAGGGAVPANDEDEDDPAAEDPSARSAFEPCADNDPRDGAGEKLLLNPIGGKKLVLGVCKTNGLRTPEAENDPSLLGMLPPLVGGVPNAPFKYATCALGGGPMIVGVEGNDTNPILSNGGGSLGEGMLIATGPCP